MSCVTAFAIRINELNRLIGLSISDLVIILDIFNKIRNSIGWRWMHWKTESAEIAKFIIHVQKYAKSSSTIVSSTITDGKPYCIYFKAGSLQMFVQ